MQKSKILGIFIIIISFILIFIGAMFFIISKNINFLNANILNNTNQITNQPTNNDIKTEIGAKDLKMIQFNSEQEFKDYLKSTEGLMNGFSSGLSARATSGVGVKDIALAQPQATGFGQSESGSGVPERFSQTNNQVINIDEPDIVKTDGINLFFSQENHYIMYEDNIVVPQVPTQGSATKPIIAPNPPQQTTAGTKIIKAYKPNDLALLSNITKNGDLLLSDKTLIVFSNDKQITGYNVSDPAKPTETWKLLLENNSYITQSRLYNGVIYLVTQNYISDYKPCPYEILSKDKNKISISCEEIYHPTQPINTDITYNVIAIDPKNGEIKNKVAFIGTSGQSVVYMSPNSLYLTYTFYPDAVSFMYNFFIEKGRGLVPESIIEKMKKLNAYEISSVAKMAEFEMIMNNFQKTLDQDQQLEVQNELSNRLSQYLSDHQRELEKTGIVKININDLKVAATGMVSGTPLNQFSMDEYQNNLRIATTISGGFMGNSSQSVSDVNVLDNSLKFLSSVKDLGKGEKIYSARFIEDKGYIVTFRQTDPFYVLDLSNANNAQLKGELKIPGFSSYLHPISKDLILGIGRDQSKVKISLFNVSDPSNPIEAAKYILDEYWTEVQNNHHAFLLDSKHKIFFLPGGKGGYIISYQDNKLELKKAVSETQVKRAIYIDNYLYIISENKILILDEKSWEKIKELSLQN